jgi:hypothetical protein
VSVLASASALKVGYIHDGSETKQNNSHSIHTLRGGQESATQIESKCLHLFFFPDLTTMVCGSGVAAVVVVVMTAPSGDGGTTVPLLLTTFVAKRRTGEMAEISNRTGKSSIRKTDIAKGGYRAKYLRTKSHQVLPIHVSLPASVRCFLSLAFFFLFCLTICVCDPAGCPLQCRSAELPCQHLSLSM